MNNKILKRIIVSALCITLLLPGTVLTVNATTKDKAEQNKNKAQDNLNSINNNISNLDNKKDTAEAKANQVNSQLVDLLVSIDILKGELADKQTELEGVQADLTAAEEKEEEQYNAMKLRIKFMYEKGDTVYLTAFLESQSFTDLINRIEYASDVYDYDRNLLAQYQETKQQISDLEVQVTSEKVELESMQDEYAQQQSSLEVMLADLKNKVKDYDSQLASAKAQAETYQKEIQQQTQLIRQEEEKNQRAQAAAAAAAKAAGNISNAAGGNSSSNSSGDQGNVTTNTGASYNSSLGSQIVAYANQFIGNSYVWGGTSLTDGTDCSGFTQQVYGHFGISIPRVSGDQRYAGVEVSYAEAQPGDLICYSGHVAIYTGGGGIVHASNPSPYPVGGIKTGTATYRTILSVRRLAQ